VELEKKTNQSRKWFKTKQIEIKRVRTKFENKLKNQMTRDEIENKIQLEIINVNKTIANERRKIN